MPDVSQSSPTYVPTATVVIPVFLIALAVMLWRLEIGGRRTWPRIAVGLLGCVYLTVVVKGVFLPCPFGTAGTFGSPWHTYINLTPLQNTDFWDDMVENALLFIPFGILVPLLTRARSAWRTTLDGALVSLSIETIQFVTDVTLHAGHAADINDWIFNTLGALIGYALLRLAMHTDPIARLVVAVAWPRRTSTSRDRRVRPSALQTEMR